MITIEGEIYETVSYAAKSRGIKYEAFRSWARRNEIPTRKDAGIHGMLIRSMDADRYKAVGAGRPKRHSDPATSAVLTSEHAGKED